MKMKLACAERTCTVRAIGCYTLLPYYLVYKRTPSIGAMRLYPNQNDSLGTEPRNYPYERHPF